MELNLLLAQPLLLLLLLVLLGLPVSEGL